MSFVFNIFAVLFVGLRQIGYAFTVPIFNPYVNREITIMEKNEPEGTPTSRATIYGVYGIITNLIYVTVIPIMGFLADSISLSFASLIILFSFLGLLLINLIVFGKLTRN